MMKRTVIVFNLLSLLCANLFAQDFNITAIVRKSGLSWEEAAAALLLAKVLDVDMTMVISTRKETATPVFVLAPAVVIAKVGKKDLREIVKMRSKGHGWGVIAHRLGVHPGAFNQQRVALSKLSDDELIAAVWLTVLSQSFNIPTSQVVKLRQRGLDWGDIVATLQVSTASQSPPEKVIALWQEMGKDWSKVRSHFGVSPDWLPVIKAKGSEALEKGRGKGVGRGKGRK
ncbi:MAG: hypothetical protein ACK40X_02960 [Armatimonadota bacterium]